MTIALLMLSLPVAFLLCASIMRNRKARQQIRKRLGLQS